MALYIVLIFSETLEFAVQHDYSYVLSQYVNWC